MTEKLERKIKELEKLVKELSRSEAGEESVVTVFNKILGETFTKKRFLEGRDKILESLGIDEVFTPILTADILSGTNVTGKFAGYYSFAIESDTLIREEDEAIANLKDSKGNPLYFVENDTSSLQQGLDRNLIKILCPRGFENKTQEWQKERLARADKLLDVLIEQLKLEYQKLQQSQQPQSRQRVSIVDPTKTSPGVDKFGRKQ